MSFAAFWCLVLRNRCICCVFDLIGLQQFAAFWHLLRNRGTLAFCLTKSARGRRSWTDRMIQLQGDEGDEGDVFFGVPARHGSKKAASLGGVNN